MWSGLSPQRRRFAAVAAVLLLGAAAATGIAVARSSSSSVHPVSQQTPGPVLLVPGYGGSTTALNSLAAYLRAHGRTAVVVALPAGGTGDLTVQAQALKRAADAELAQTKARSIDVVGYSAGGVVTRLWVRDDGGGSQARRVVTLGSPQHGTEVAALAGSLLPGACPTACQQLATDSSLLDGLNRGSETPKGPTFVSIYTSHDTVVVPPESAELSGALNIKVQSVCPANTANHTQLPTDPLVQAMVRAELAAGPPVPLAAGDCSRLSS